MSDFLSDVRATDTMLDLLATRQMTESEDAVLAGLACLACAVDQHPMPETLAPRARPVRPARKCGWALSVTAALTLASSGVAAAVTDDPLAPFHYVTNHLTRGHADAPSGWDLDGALRVSSAALRFSPSSHGYGAGRPVIESDTRRDDRAADRVVAPGGHSRLPSTTSGHHGSSPHGGPPQNRPPHSPGGIDVSGGHGGNGSGDHGSGGNGGGHTTPPPTRPGGGHQHPSMRIVSHVGKERPSLPRNVGGPPGVPERPTQIPANTGFGKRTLPVLPSLTTSVHRGLLLPWVAPSPVEETATTTEVAPGRHP